MNVTIIGTGDIALGVRSIERGKRETFVPRRHRIFPLVQAFAPAQIAHGPARSADRRRAPDACR
jgi:hypothetical protein